MAADMDGEEARQASDAIHPISNMLVQLLVARGSKSVPSDFDDDELQVEGPRPLDSLRITDAASSADVLPVISLEWIARVPRRSKKSAWFFVEESIADLANDIGRPIRVIGNTLYPDVLHSWLDKGFVRVRPEDMHPGDRVDSDGLPPVYYFTKTIHSADTAD